MKKYKKIFKGEKVQFVIDRIVIILHQRKDVTRLMMPTLVNTTQHSVDVACTRAREKGIYIWPSNGYGTPLKIVQTPTDAKKYLLHRRNKYLPTTQRDILTTSKFEKRFKELEGVTDTLMVTINNTTNENNGI